MANFYVYYPPNDIVTAVITGPVEVTQGTTPWVVSGTVDAVIVPNGTIKNYYSEVNSVSSGVLTTLQTYTVSSSSATLMEADVSGTNIAKYMILLNNIILDKHLTYFGGALNTTFDFAPGLPLANGDVVTVQVLHNRPMVGDFNSRILVSEA